MKVDQSHYFDISPCISQQTAVFPGDTAYKRNVHMSVEAGDHIGLSSIESTVHIGAHADAPSHYGKSQAGIHELELTPYMGLAQVIHLAPPKGARISWAELAKTPIQCKRVLLATNSFPDSNQWNSDFNSLSPELIEKLHEQGVVLVGIDTPSVDPSDCKTMDSHHMLLKTQMRVLEGLVLEHVPGGLYQLLALPLSLKDADASPVRAILLPQNADLSRR